MRAQIRWQAGSKQLTTRGAAPLACTPGMHPGLHCSPSSPKIL